MRDDLEKLPGVGPATAGDLRSLGIGSRADLAGRSPERLYEALREAAGGRLDRCVLWTLRCAVYHATATAPDPALSDWWLFKDGRPGAAALEALGGLR